ncbi:MAG: hypothetical protein JXR83_16045, partial [Deltaproteobacteria bacterium]|nr:hypothetical protein [Deltaproteobacteria bacterium]
TPASGNPPALFGHDMAFDSASSRTLLFGGYSQSGPSSDGIWEWDGETWTERPTGASHPVPRISFAMAYDGLRDRTVVFGGANQTGKLGDTWEWEGESWSQKLPVTARPPARCGHAMAFDSFRDRVVMYAGYTNYGTTLQDTWEWNGLSWTQRTTGSNPLTRYGHTMAFDSARNRAVLFGGYRYPSLFLQDTWEWDGTSWVERTLGSGNPPVRTEHAMAFDSARGRSVMFGGCQDEAGLQDTWEWDGSTWVEKTPATTIATAVADPAMVFDSARNRVVLFGGAGYGEDYLQETWEWDGQDWIDRTPAGDNPPARVEHALAFDSVRNRVVLFGGWGQIDGQEIVWQDTWEWDGQSWVERQPGSAVPQARRQHTLAFDTARNRVVLFGGYGGEYMQDTWEYDSGADRQPAVQFTVATAVAGVAPADLLGLRVRAHCGGTFAPHRAGDVGTTLLGWATGGPALPPGSWQELASNSVGIAAAPPYLPAPPAALIDWTTASSSEIEDLIFESDNTFNFQCRLAGIPGAPDATVALDYIEVRVRYRTR